VREIRALDHALLAAATSQVAGHDRYDISTWVAAPGDARIPPRIQARAAQGDEPLVKDQGKDRLVLVPTPGGTDVLAAIAPRVTLARSVGALAGVWLLSSSAILLAAALVVQRGVRRAFLPLVRAREDVARVMALGQGERVATSAPVEVAPLLAAINALLERLEGAHALQVRFVADAAHELRTPVTALLGQLEVALRRDRTSEELRATLESARNDVGHLRRLVEALTALARVDAGEVEAHKEAIRAADLAQTALDGERGALDASGCKVALHADDDPEIHVHPVLLELALRNLLRNAARHAPGSEVTLTIRCEGTRTVFEVRDTGPGISPDDTATIFDRFARGSGAPTRDPTGLGLGLPLAREVARRHGGECTLRPLPTGGTRAVLEVQSIRASG
jgi:two-component system sensor histidine kinase BaeS